MALITPQEVINLAFSQVDHVSVDLIKATKIDAAQEEYVRPVFGGLYNKMLSGGYPEFVNTYVKPALAYYVRYGTIPDMSIQMGNNGLNVNYQSYSNSATDKQRDMLRTQAMKDANTLLDKAVRYVECHREDFPEYEPRRNIQKKVVIKGNIIF